MAYSFRLKPGQTFSVAGTKFTLLEITDKTQVVLRVQDGELGSTIKLKAGAAVQPTQHASVSLDRRTSKAHQYAMLVVSAPPSTPVLVPE